MFPRKLHLAIPTLLLVPMLTLMPVLAAANTPSPTLTRPNLPPWPGWIAKPRTSAERIRHV